MPHKAALLARIAQRSARVGVIGLGYVGLPLALEFARAGFNTLGIENNSARADDINAGRSYIPDVAQAELAALVQAGRLAATTDYAAIRELDAVIICVPTPLRKTRDPDMSFVVSATERVAEHLHAGLLVVLESTTYPGTTDEVVLPRMLRTGLVAGAEIFVAFSPERIDPANLVYGVRNTPKVIGGVTSECCAVAAALYATVADAVVPVSTARTAEMVKLLENTFRAVNIGLINEVAIICGKLGVNVWEVIAAARTKPFGFMPFYPGPGLGGHCIPIDPFYLTWKAREFGQHTRFIELAGEINTAMPLHVVNQVAHALNAQKKPLNGSRVLALGLAYKADVDDMRESPTFLIMDRLKAQGATVDYYDPHIPVITPTREHAAWTGTKSVCWGEATLRGYDAIVICTAHKGLDYASLVKWSPCLVDTRNALRDFSGAHITKA